MKNKKQIMVDLETFGTTPGSIITSIGAVWFGGGKIHDEFYAKINPASCAKLGMTMNPDTILWWLGQSDDARKEMIDCGKGQNLKDVLFNFSVWVSSNISDQTMMFPAREVQMWGNGATFDNILLRDAYERVGITRPWTYSGDLCYRTVKNLRPDIEIERTGTHHNALEDAKSQAIHLMKIGEALGLQL